MKQLRLNLAIEEVTETAVVLEAQTVEEVVAHMAVLLMAMAEGEGDE